MAQFNYFDYGRAVQDGQQIKSNRIKNKMAGMQADEASNFIKQREEAKKIRDQVENMPAAIAEMESRGLYDEAAKARDVYINQKYNSVKLLSTLRENINGDNYDKFREDMLQSGAVEPEFLPTEYSDDWFRTQIKQEKNKLQTFTRQWSEQGNTLSQDFIADEYGNVRWEGSPYESAADRKAREGGGKGSGGGFKAADSNAIKSLVATQFYSGLWDPVTNEVRGLNKDQGKEFASLTEEASRIFNSNDGNITHAESVARAARRMNITVPNVEQDTRRAEGLRRGMVDFATQGADQMLNSNDMNDPLGLYR
jgi:hypothetical protein